MGLHLNCSTAWNYIAELLAATRSAKGGVLDVGPYTWSTSSSPKAFGGDFWKWKFELEECLGCGPYPGQDARNHQASLAGDPGPFEYLEPFPLQWLPKNTNFPTDQEKDPSLWGPRESYLERLKAHLLRMAVWLSDWRDMYEYLLGR